MTDVVENLLRAALMECCPPGVVRRVTHSAAFFSASESCVEDLGAFAKKDPSAKSRTSSVLQGSSAFRAVLHYRLAHALLTCPIERELEAETYAALLSCRGRLASGAELHPRSAIGRRFVLDHGWGTVIGETSWIGDDCYVLGSVTLGARGVAHNPVGRRHPTVGNRVEVGAFTRIYGDIHIGDDVFIGSHCVVTHDVPSGSRVTLRSELQTTRTGLDLQSAEPMEVRATAGYE
jgi:serine O-acetyltransferase